MPVKTLVILGIRGVPAQHGGFETFAEYLALYLIEQGWSVTVYCQEEGSGEIYESVWQGVRRIHIPVKGSGALSTVIFDFKSVCHSLNQDGLFLTLGYNTAIFNLLHRLKRITNIINMDGIEWKRQKWGFVAKAWFWLNERLGCWFGNYLVADHPLIEDHLSTRVPRKKITMIPYGAEQVLKADEEILGQYGLTKGNYLIVIARAEPENSILEIVSAFSAKERDKKLVILGNYSPETNPYHRAVIEAASADVLFLGAIYDSEKVGSLRFYAFAYIHGHQVGGTNPSLVESLGAGNAVIAHDNNFNRWVAGNSGVYFQDKQECQRIFDERLHDENYFRGLSENAKLIFKDRFRWHDILSQYEHLFLKTLNRGSNA